MLEGTLMSVVSDKIKQNYHLTRTVTILWRYHSRPWRRKLKEFVPQLAYRRCPPDLLLEAKHKKKGKFTFWRKIYILLQDWNIK
jgi:hypothetical protein